MENQQVIHKMLQDMQLRGLSKGTQKSYSENIKLFQKYFNKPATELWEQEIREYLHYLRNDKKLSTSAVNTCNCALRFLYEVTLEKNLNYKRVPRLKEPYTLPNIFAKDEVQAIFSATENLKHKCILMTIYGAGLRVSEVTTLKVSDIDSKNMRIFIEQSKGKKDRYALLSQLNLDVLREYWKQYKPKYWLFGGSQKDSHITRRGVQDIFKKCLKKSGIQTEATVHTLRHSFATHLLENGTSLFYIRELLGHATIRTTTHYLHVAVTDVLKTTSPLDILQKEGKPKKKRGRKPKIKEVPHFA